MLLLVLLVVPLLVTPLLSRAAAAADPVGSGWTWPLDGPRTVVRPFAPGPTRYSPGHYGADLAGAPGQPVRAAGAGRVSYAGLLAGRGVVVVVHGALRTTYEPVSAAVVVGQQVDRGTVLGRLGAGHACGRPACLHWGLRRGPDYLDPVRLLGGEVRLLPTGGLAGAGAARTDDRTAGPRVARPTAGSRTSLGGGRGAVAGGGPGAVDAPRGSVGGTQPNTLRGAEARERPAGPARGQPVLRRTHGPAWPAVLLLLSAGLVLLPSRVRQPTGRGAG